MNRVFIVLASCLLLALSCNKPLLSEEDCDCLIIPWVTDTTQRSTSPSLKGFILFSWENEEDDWNYSIVPNLNITPADEMVNSGNIFTGTSCLKLNLSLLAFGEDVFWSCEGKLDISDSIKVELEFPDLEIIEEIQSYCDSIDIDLTVY